MKTNRTLRYLDSGEVEFLEHEVGRPGAGEIQVEGGVCGICSWDIATAKLGKQAPAMAPPGHEGLAYVTAVGDGVEDFKVGDRVACGVIRGNSVSGAFSTCRNIPTSSAYLIPQSDLADAFWLVEPVSCVVTGLDHSKVKIADKIVVLGCGFMGLMFAQALLKSFAGEVIGLDISDVRLAKAKELGLINTYNIGNENSDTIIESLFEKGIDTVIDTSGSAQGFDAACRIVKRNGLVNMFGWVKSQESMINLSRFHTKAIQIVNTPPVSQIRDPFPVAIEAIHSGLIDLKPLVTDVVSLNDYPALLDRVIKGDPNYIKGVVRLEV